MRTTTAISGGLTVQLSQWLCHDDSTINIILVIIGFQSQFRCCFTVKLFLRPTFILNRINTHYYMHYDTHGPAPSG